MIGNVNLFARPETLDDVKEGVTVLKEHIKTVEALEHAKDCLARHTPLASRTLSKCNVFIDYVNNSDPDTNFNMEVSKLSLNELAFSSITFEERRLKTLLDSFKASHIRQYIEKQSISCLGRSEIFTRFKNILPKCRGSKFDVVYQALVQAMANSTESDVQMNDVVPSEAPRTAADEPQVFQVLGAHSENIKDMFGVHIANATCGFKRLFPGKWTQGVRSR